VKRAVLALLVAAALAAGGWWVRARTTARATVRQVVPTAAIKRGALTITLPVSGFLQSAEETRVISEIGGTLLYIQDNNEPVQPGDLVFQIDTKELVDQRDDLMQKLVDARAELDKAQADAQVQTSQAQSEVDRAQEALGLAEDKAQAERDKVAAEVRFAESEVARAHSELARAQRLAKLNYIPGTKLREAEANYRKQEFELERKRADEVNADKRTGEEVQQARTALGLAQQNLEATATSARLRLDDARVTVEQTERRLDEAQDKIDQCTVLAPTAGLAVVQTNRENWSERRPYRAGDRVSPGREPIMIFNLQKMQVRCQIGEMDISRVRAGQEAFVPSPSEPAKRYRAKVISVEEMARESNVWEGGTPGKKVFGVLVGLEQSDPAHLRPGMTVDLEIVLRELQHVMMAPIRAVFARGASKVVYRQRGEQFEALAVETGARSDLAVEVSGGLKDGDRVALAVPPVGARHALPLRRAEGR